MENYTDNFDLWEQFSKSGQVSDYLKYKQIDVPTGSFLENNLHVSENNGNSYKTT